MTTIAQYERSALADLLEQVGPDAPTLCDGWTARDLAAHLVVREHRADTLPGLGLPFLAAHTASVQRGYAKRPFPRLVAMVRDGAPLWSAFRLPQLDRLLNTTEYFVHHEDVRRARPGWAPRDLPAAVQDALWTAVKGRSALAFRDLTIGVTLARPDGTTQEARRGEPVAVVTGEPAEVLLYLFGRREHARVEVTGAPAAISALRGSELDV